MSICADDDWAMDLVKYGSQDKETFTFYNLRIDNEDITGKVKDQGGKTSDLTGKCSPLLETVARLTFSFEAVGPRVGVEMFLTGLAIQLPDKTKPIFRGQVVALPLAALSTSPVDVKFDVGDTGTGSGMQAMFRTPEP
jgi:hypothetical protein